MLLCRCQYQILVEHRRGILLVLDSLFRVRLDVRLCGAAVLQPGDFTLELLDLPIPLVQGLLLLDLELLAHANHFLFALLDLLEQLVDVLVCLVDLNLAHAPRRGGDAVDPALVGLPLSGVLLMNVGDQAFELLGDLRSDLRLGGNQPGLKRLEDRPKRRVLLLELLQSGAVLAARGLAARTGSAALERPLLDLFLLLLRRIRGLVALFGDALEAPAVGVVRGGLWHFVLRGLSELHGLRDGPVR